MARSRPSSYADGVNAAAKDVLSGRRNRQFEKPCDAVGRRERNGLDAGFRKCAPFAGGRFHGRISRRARRSKAQVSLRRSRFLRLRRERVCTIQRTEASGSATARKDLGREQD